MESARQVQTEIVRVISGLEFGVGQVAVLP